MIHPVFARSQLALASAAIGIIAATSRAQNTNTNPTLMIKADQVVAKSSPMLYGLMTEEINYSYEGGLYGELIRNRSMKANATNVVFWSAVGGAFLALDTNMPLNSVLDASLKLDASQSAKVEPAGVANGGYWGIAIKPKTHYTASFYAKAANGFTGPLTVCLQSADGKTNLATAEISGLTGDWKKYETTLTTKNVAPSKDNRFVITTSSPATIWFDHVSLFGPTYAHRANGNRPDIMQLLADMHPKFLRFPGGNYLEGNTIETRFNWKNTIGDVSERPGHVDDGWGYWSTDGMGLLEYLNWCEDLHMEPLLAVYAGYSLRQHHVTPGPDLEPYVQDALDEIEYVTGDASTKWGAERAKDGHPKPFILHYVEIGNEDQFDRSRTYDGRFTQFFDAIKQKYPQLLVIATATVSNRVPDMIDEHFYRSQEEMEAHAHDYDKRARVDKPKVFVGEWATRVGSPTPTMAGALGDAAWMTGMERNSDFVLMASYAPLFVNVSDLERGGSMQWRTDLIGYDALHSYGSPAYYAQKMFSLHHGDEILGTDSRDISTYTWHPRPRRRFDGSETTPPPPQEVPTLFFDATRDSKSGVIYLKVVNRLDTPQTVNIEISGAAIKSKGSALVLKADKPDDTNSILEPEKIIPIPEKLAGLGNHFTRAFPPYSITVLGLSSH
jgi:alpha-N-arabinofuranosidase